MRTAIIIIIITSPATRGLSLLGCPRPVPAGHVPHLMPRGVMQRPLGVV